MLREGYLQRIDTDKLIGHDSYSMNNGRGYNNSADDGTLHLDHDFLDARKPTRRPREHK